MADTGKTIAYIGLAGLAGYVLYKILSKATPANPGDVQKLSVRYRGVDGPITWDSKIVAEISWKNVGGSDISPGFKLSMKPPVGTPIGDEDTRSWATSPKGKPGEIVRLTADSLAIPPNWKRSLFIPPFRIHMRLLLNDGGSGFLWDEQEVIVVDKEELMSVSNIEAAYVVV